MNTQLLYDVFISHSPKDREWVEQWLLPALEKAGLRVAIDYRDFTIGKPRLENIESALEQSQRTIVVVTPDWLSDEWNNFEALLLRTADPAARRRKMLPLLLKPAPLPESIATLEKADLTVEKQWDRQLHRLTRDIRDTIPVSFPGKTGNAGQWQRWVYYHRRGLVVGLLLAWLLSSLAWQWPPFQPRLSWQAEMVHAPGAHKILNTGDTLVIGAKNEQEGCATASSGLWVSALPLSTTWESSIVSGTLCIEWWEPPSLANIQALAALPGTAVVYALTSHSGLLISQDGGRRFAPYAATFPQLETDNTPSLLIVSNTPTPTLWITGITRGLWRYRDENWARLDGTNGCAGLPEIGVSSLLVTETTVLIGTNQRGLWLSDDDMATCRLVFDGNGRYQFLGLWDISQETYARYLTLVYDGFKNPHDEKLGTSQLLIICPRPHSCQGDRWAIEPTPIWHRTTSVYDILVQKDAQGHDEWYLTTALGQVWHGNMYGVFESLPTITRCFLPPLCTPALASSESDSYPYLLAADHVYRLTQGPWWRRLWP